MVRASFRGRREAGRFLTDEIRALGLVNPLVFAIPKGGLPVAHEIAGALGVSMDVAPGPEHETKEPTEFSAVTADHAPAKKHFDDLGENEIVVVDDLIANGAAALAAIRVLRANGAARIIVATPMISQEALRKLLALDNVEVCAIHVVEETPAVTDLFAGEEEEFVSDDELRTIATESRKQKLFGEAETEWIDIRLGEEGTLAARWRAPKTIRGAVVVVNTEGDMNGASQTVEKVSARFDADGIATLSLNFTEYAEDVASLSKTIRRISTWLEEFEPAQGIPLAYLGIGFGGAAMLEAAAGTPEKVRALVCLEAPLHLIADFIPRLHAPTLLVLRSERSENLEGNRKAFEDILVEKSITILEGKSETVVSVIETWMDRFLSTSNALKKTRSAKPIESGLRI